MPKSSSDLRNTEGRTIASIKTGTGGTGALLIHGYLATPEEMRGLAEHLAAKGLRVYAPLVAGHGTTMLEFKSTQWEDWYASVEGALKELQGLCTSVFVVGISLGGVQALHLAAHHPEISGIVALAPAVRFRFNPMREWRKASDMKLWLITLMPWLAALYPGEPSNGQPHFLHTDIRDEEARKEHIFYKFNPTSGVLQMLEYAQHLKKELPQIRQPLLIIHSPQDGSIPVRSSEYVMSRVSSEDRTLDLTTAANSWHVLTEDVDRMMVYNAVSEFITLRTGGE